MKKHEDVHWSHRVRLMSKQQDQWLENCEGRDEAQGMY
jgi:hypothetical protein